jgi:hypothetical protein
MPTREEKALDRPDNPDEYVNLEEEILVERGGRNSVEIVVSVCLEPQVADRLAKQSEREGKRVSQLVREAVIAYVAELEALNEGFHLRSTSELICGLEKGPRSGDRGP